MANASVLDLFLMVISGEIRPNKEQATGRELEELQGKWKEEVLDSHFGTKENPVLVPSHYSARVVGCVGMCLHVLNFIRYLVCSL